MGIENCDLILDPMAEASTLDPVQAFVIRFFIGIKICQVILVDEAA